MNELNKTEKTVCSLLSAALFQNAKPLPDDIDWQAVYPELTAHAVTELVRDVLLSHDIPQAIRQDCISRHFSFLVKCTQIKDGQQALAALLRDNGIAYAILKGAAAAQYYPSEFDRSPGDVDFLVPASDYARTLTLLAENGYAKPDEFEDNYRHTSFEKDEIRYECHRSFADGSFRNAETIDALLAGGLASAETVTTGFGSFRCLKTAYNGLVLLEHVAIHLKSGLGLRQILDWLLYAEQHLSDADWARENGALIRKCGLEKLAKVLTKAGQLYFGVKPEITWCADASESVCAELMRLVFAYGNFGKKNTVDDKVVSVAQKYRKGALHNLKQAGEHNWKVLHKRPWLKPLAPVYQVFRYTGQVLSKKGALKALLRNKKAVDERVQLLEALGIDSN